MKHTFFLLVPLLSFSLFGSKATPLFDLNSIRDASTLEAEILSDWQLAQQDAWEKAPLQSDWGRVQRDHLDFPGKPKRLDIVTVRRQI